MECSLAILIIKGKVSCLLKNGKLFGGIPGTINELNLYKLSLHKKKLGKKVAVVINNNTASAAESLLLALKNNPNVKFLVCLLQDILRLI